MVFQDGGGIGDGEEGDGTIRVKAFEAFDEGSGEDDIAEEGSLEDKDFQEKRYMIFDI